MIENNELAVQLVSVTKEIPNYGVSDLIDLLRLIASQRGSPQLSLSRPPIVRKYLMKLAMENTKRDGIMISTPTDLKQLLTQLLPNCMLTTASTCLHDFPVSFL